MDKNDSREESREVPVTSALRYRFLLLMLLNANVSIAILALLISPRLQVMDQDVIEMNLEPPFFLELLRGLNHHWTCAILIYSSLALLAAPALTLAISNKSSLRKAAATYLLALTIPITAIHGTLSLGFSLHATLRDGPCSLCHFYW